MSKDTTSMAIKTTVYIHILSVKAEKMRVGVTKSYSDIIEDAMNGYYGVLK